MIKLGHIFNVYGLDDGSLATTTSWSHNILIYNPYTGSLIRQLIGVSEFPYSIILLKDGILATGHYDNPINIWNYQAGTCLRTLTGYSLGVHSLEVLPKSISKKIPITSFNSLSVYQCNLAFEILKALKIFIYLFGFPHFGLNSK